MSRANIPEDKLACQVDWEREAAEAGRSEYLNTIQRARERGVESFTRYGRTILNHSLSVLVDRLAALQQEAEARPGRRFVAFKLLKSIDIPTVAYIGLRTLIDSLSEDRILTEVASAIGKRIEDEIRLRLFQEFNKKRAEVLFRRVSHTSHYRHKITSIVHGMNCTEGWEWTNWTAQEKIHVGMLIISATIESTGLFEINTIHRRNKSYKILRPTNKTMEWITTQLNAPILSPLYMPTLIPPKDWEGPIGGGYYSQFMPKLTFVRTKFKNYAEELSNRTEEMAKVYKAVNLIQKTPWRINQQVLRVLEALWEQKFEGAGIPAQEDLPLPPCPVCGNAIPARPTGAHGKGNHVCFTLDQEALKQWKQAAAKIHQINGKSWSKRLLVLRLIWMARKCADLPEFYYPYVADFRGRLYPVVSYLQPQGCDIAKGLLEFAHGVPLGEHGGKWLAIHVANTYGKDKVSFAERIRWVEEHTQEILDIARNPLDNLAWTEADSPFCFLAACFEWARYMEEGPSYVSHLPVALDGSCNGIQHFSAMLRDPIGGAAVNLVPADAPADIYQEVANKVVESLHAIANDPDGDPEDVQFAKDWLAYGVDRKTVKRPVMILPYGGTRYSCQDYILEAITEASRTGKSTPWDTYQGIRAAAFLARLVWSAINLTLTGACQVMAWLQKIARLYNQAGIPILWQSPSGFYVLQKYPDIESHKVKTHLLGSITFCQIGVLGKTLDQKKQVAGISPNFVHSMDAAALVLTTLKAAEHGIQAFAMIHDSYGTHAGNTEIFHRLIRETFADMYKDNDVLAQLYETAKSTLNIAIPKPPAQGSLDIDMVRQSPYFFA